MAQPLEKSAHLCAPLSAVAERDLLGTAFELNPLPMWICDPGSLQLLAANQAAIKQYGYSRQEFLSLTAQMLFATENPDAIFSFCTQHGESVDEAGVRQTRHMTKSGHVFDVDMRGNAIPFGKGSARLITAEDVTARRRTERTLTARYELMRILWENPGDVVTRFLRCLCECLDYSAADLWLLDPGSDSFRREGFWRRYAADEIAVARSAAPEPLQPLQEREFRQVSASGDPCWIPQVAAKPPYRQTRPAQAQQPGGGIAFRVSVGPGSTRVALLFDGNQASPGSEVIQLLAEAGAELGHCLELRRIAEESRRADDAFFEDAPIPYHEIDVNGVVTRTNHAECELLGRVTEEIVGKPVWELVSPEDRIATRESVLRRLQERCADPPIERTFRTSLGEEHVFRIHNRRMIGRSGEVAGLRTAMLDITGVRQYRQRIELQRDLLDQVNDAVLTVDKDFRIQYFNAGAESLFGCRNQDAIGKPYKTIAGTAVTDQQREAIHADILARGSWSGEIICTKKDGGQFLVHVSWSVLRDSDGNPIGVVGIHRDITAPKQMEQALRASEDRLQLAQSALALGTWDVDLDSGTVQCSQQLLRLYGLSGSREQITLEEWHACVHPDDRQGKINDARSHFDDREPFDRQFRVLWPDGSVHWLHSKARTIFDRRRQATRVIGVDFDITETKQTEERLRILSSAVEQSPISIMLSTLDGRIEYANPTLIRATGYTLEELQGKHPSLLLSGDTPPEELEEISKALHRGAWRGVLRSRRKSGELFWESVTIILIRDASGQPTHQLSMAEDITERVEIEAAWKLSEDRFRVAAESSGDWIFEWDPKDDTLRSLGEHKADRVDFGGELPVTGTAFAALIHPGDRARIRKAVRRSIATERPFAEEYRLLWPSGETRYWASQGSVLHDAEGAPSRWIGVCKDITAQKKAERARADLAAVVECAAAAIVRRDLADRVTSWNRGAESMYGYPSEEMYGRAFDVLIAPEKIAEYAATREKLLRGESVTHLESKHRVKSGKVIDVLLSMFQVYDPDGTLAGTACVAWDITQTRQLEAQLAQARKLESIGQLAAGIAHEINTPMQFIGDSVYFLRQSFEDLWRLLEAYGALGREAENVTDLESLTAGVREILDTADLPYLQENIPRALERTQEGIEHVSAIVGAMKEFAHPQTNQKVLADINKSLRNALTVSRNEYKYVAEMESDFGEIPSIPCHIGELNQVFLNLIINAAHAVGDAVKGTDQRGRIRVSTTPEEEAVAIRIQDTGTGIPEEIRERIFDPFFTTKAVGKGTGQGLAISRSIIVDKHGGTLTFESEAGCGTTFVIRLPLTEAHSSAQDVAA